MKVKNIMFSGFAAAILMGVGAAHAVVANPVTLADQGYVDAKVAAVAGQKEAIANKMNATTAEATNLDVLAADEANYPSVAAAVQIAGKKASEVITEVNQVAGNLTDLTNKVNGLVDKVNTTGTVADAIAGALADAKADATTKADKALADAKTYTDEQITALDLANKYDAKGAAAQALADAKVDTASQIAALDLANTYDAKGAAAQALADAKVDTASQIAALDLANTYEEKGAAASQIAALDLANTYEAKGEAAKALTDAKAYTDQEVGKVDVKVTANANAITTLNGDGDGSVKKMAADAATAAVNASGHAQKTYVDDELAKKLDKTAIDNAAGTYMVTSDGNGGFTYTKVKVATGVDSEGNATVTE